MRVRIVQPQSGGPKGNPRWFIIGGLIIAGLAGIGTFFLPLFLAILTGIGFAMVVWGIILAVMQTFQQ